MAEQQKLGIDIYREGASAAFGVPYHQVTPAQREVFRERFTMLGGSYGMDKESTRVLVKRTVAILRAQFSPTSRR